MIRLVTEEIPTRATKILALKLSVGGSPIFSLFYAHPPPRALERSCRPVADARDGLYDLRPRRVALDLGPEPAYVYVYVAARQIMRPRGDGLGDLGPRKGLPGTAHEEREYLELRRCEIQRLPRAANGVTVRIQLQRTQPQKPFPAPAILPETPEDGFDPR